MNEQGDRRERILQSAAEMFARKGVSATTVREIADAVGVLSGSLYHHFESKDAMVGELLNRYLDSIRQRYAEVIASDGTASERLHKLVLASLQTTAEHPYATAIYQNEQHYLREQPGFKIVQSAATDVQRTWLKIIKDGVADGSFRDDIEPRTFYRLIRDAVWLSVRYQKSNGASSVERMANEITSIFLDGFSAPAKRGQGSRAAGNGTRSGTRRS
jgi:AcrR family transcriptional regulator